jgi:3'-5' exoribonuclease
MPGTLVQARNEELENRDERMQLQPLLAGRSVSGAVCLRKKTAALTKAGQPYLTIEVCNSTGAVATKVWSESVGAWDGIAVGDPVHLEGRLTAGWRGVPPELQVARVEPLPKPHPVQLEANPISPVPLDVLRARFRHLLGFVSDAAETLVDVVLEHVGRERWWTAPAAKLHHHACVHGLAWHSVEVAETALALAQATGAGNHIDADALVSGALLHDIGKVAEYVWEGVPIDLSRQALLDYHTASGGVMTMVAVDRDRDRLAAAGVTEALVQHLLHVQLSHHGEAAHGSPVPPRTLEALLIHQADLASARVRAFLDDLASGPPDADGWVTPAGWGKKPVLAYAVHPKAPLPQSKVRAPAGVIDAASAPRREHHLSLEEAPEVKVTDETTVR